MTGIKKSGTFSNPISIDPPPGMPTTRVRNTLERAHKMTDSMTKRSPRSQARSSHSSAPSLALPSTSQGTVRQVKQKIEKNVKEGEYFIVSGFPNQKYQRNKNKVGAKSIDIGLMGSAVEDEEAGEG